MCRHYPFSHISTNAEMHLFHSYKLSYSMLEHLYGGARSLGFLNVRALRFMENVKPYTYTRTSHFAYIPFPKIIKKKLPPTIYCTQCVQINYRFHILKTKILWSKNIIVPPTSIRYWSTALHFQCGCLQWSFIKENIQEKGALWRVTNSKLSSSTMQVCKLNKSIYLSIFFPLSGRKTWSKYIAYTKHNIINLKKICSPLAHKPIEKPTSKNHPFVWWCAIVIHVRLSHHI